ncbi:MAG: TrkA family potassium uptake protein [Candidatus Ancillula sp.]|jgi:trk system potassium uptake protein TrkA|nr:TrkA family potassium uptake protein [Candidatus Ancillula sp.]
MNILVVGGGAVGKSVSRQLAKDKDNQVTIIDFELESQQKNPLNGVKWVSGDATDRSVQVAAGAETADVFVVATGDDQANLVASMIAKSEFNVPKVIARVNHPKNSPLFIDSWGVDLAVSTPKTLTTLIQDAVAIDKIVPVFDFAQSGSKLLKYTIGPDSSYIGQKNSGSAREQFELPANTVFVALTRQGKTYEPNESVIFEAGDELLFLAHSFGM